MIVLIGIWHAAARVDDHVALGQEAIGHADRLIERAARIAAQIQQKAARALPGEILQRLAEIMIGVFRKVLQADVASVIVHHEVRGNRRNIDFVARDFEWNQLVVAGAADTELHRGALWSAQFAHGLIARPALGILGANARDDVAASDALLVRGRALEERLDGDIAVHDRDRDAETVVVPFLFFAQLSVGLRIHEARMGIERLQHAADGAVDQAIGLHLVHVPRLDEAQSRRERPVVIGQTFVGGGGTSAEDASNDGGSEDRQRDEGNTAADHEEIVTDNLKTSNDFEASAYTSCLDRRSPWFL